MSRLPTATPALVGQEHHVQADFARSLEVVYWMWPIGTAGQLDHERLHRRAAAAHILGCHLSARLRPATPPRKHFGVRKPGRE